ncbi:Uncharacterised protein [Cedecea lapagei]|uniref:Uncharacterized protein n=1 Tax=Cedecea lapagei TaxID=158823 RepID=A0A447V1T7_9ENTR|nr:hypothetical protein [Cedecea lapagei]VEB97385.1 Uncharacterised protein [Cedecea lapagei]
MTVKIYTKDSVSPMQCYVALSDYEEPQRKLAAYEDTVTDLAAQVQGLAAENAYLLPKAASELSNAWVLNKYWVGIHAALMHFGAGREHDAIEWLQNTVAGPGIEVPKLSEFAEIEAWAVEQQKDSISAARALEVIKAETPATEASLAEIRAEGAEMFVSALQKHVDEGDFVGDEIAVITGAIDAGGEFAEKLRKEQGK